MIGGAAPQPTTHPYSNRVGHTSKTTITKTPATFTFRVAISSAFYGQIDDQLCTNVFAQYDENL